MTDAPNPMSRERLAPDDTFPRAIGKARVVDPRKDSPNQTHPVR